MSTVTAYWQSSKAIIKLFIVGLIMLLLLIPAFMVQHLVAERQSRQKEAIAEVSSKWGSKQSVAGPLIALPYIETQKMEDGKWNTVKKWAYLLPEKSNITATVVPQQRKRGIYKIMLYHTTITMNGNFVPGQLAQLGIAPDKVLWNEGRVRMHISDLKGLTSEPQLLLNNKSATATPGISNNYAYLEAPLPADSSIHTAGLAFNATLKLNGTEALWFIPVGKQTSVSTQTTWPHPSYVGAALPLQHPRKGKIEVATWQSLSHNRSFPQQWKDAEYDVYIDNAVMNRDVEVATSAGRPNLGKAAFGVSLYMPVDNYQQTERSVKYAILCILLTFAAIYLMDVSNSKAVHPLQYALVGLALVLFYVLLLAFGEYISFALAYSIAAVATIGLIGWFMHRVLSSGRLSTALSLILAFVYAYLFTLLQLQDYALLLGSIGLFVTLAVVMHFSKRFSW